MLILPNFQIRENSQIVENAILARDSALEREKKKQEELERIRVTMETIVEEAADRVKNEVTRVKGQCNANLQRMVDEMQVTEWLKRIKITGIAK